MSNSFTISIPAGPIWNNEDAQTKGPMVAAAHGGKWNGQWRTVVEGEMSTVDIELPSPAASENGGANFTLSVPAGPIWNNEDAQTKAPVVAASYNGKWNGQWRTIVEGQMSTIDVAFAY
jgi:hypothetical protein